MYQAVKFPRLNLLFAGHVDGYIRQISSLCAHIQISTNKRSSIQPATGMVNANNLWYRNKVVSYRSKFVYNSLKNSSN